MIAVIDYGLGNLFSLLSSLRFLGAEAQVTADPAVIEEADKLTEPSRIVFLIKEPSKLVDDYCNRPDHQGFNNFINSKKTKNKNI